MSKSGLALLNAVLLAAVIIAGAASTALGGPGEEARALGIPDEYFISPEQAVKAAFLECILADRTSSFEATAVLSPVLVIARDSSYPLAFYGVTVVKGMHPNLDAANLMRAFKPAPADITAEPKTAADAAELAAGWWYYNNPAAQKPGARLETIGLELIGSFLVTADRRYPMLVAKGPDITAGAATAVCVEGLMRGAEPAELPHADTINFNLFFTSTGGSGFTAVTYAPIVSEFPSSPLSYFDTRESYGEFAGPGDPRNYTPEDTSPWGKRVAAVAAWLETGIPVGNTVAVDAAALTAEYKRYLKDYPLE